MVQVIQQTRTKRVPRRPSHTWQIRRQAFVIQPFMLAPVLPGETLQSVLFQARTVTKPIKNPLIGWHLEHYFFYVKHRDLPEPFRTKTQEMMLDMTTDVSSLVRGTVSAPLYTAAGAFNWTEACLQRVVEEFFRDEGEAWNNFTIEGLPASSINVKNWSQSLMLDSDMPTGTSTSSPDTQLELDAMYQQWEFMRANQMVNMSYEDWLATYGVRPKTVEIHRPELLRYNRAWSYPTNTIDPATGTPSSAVSWAISERIDKDRFFKEPGFIFGVSCVRPKVYFSAQTGSAAGVMDTAFSWLPAIMKDEVYTSLKKFTSGGILPGVTADHWIDMRDLLLYGDQYVNFALSDTSANFVPMPTATTEHKYPTEVMAEALFATTGQEYINEDGVAQLSILGTQIDHS